MNKVSRNPQYSVLLILGILFGVAAQPGYVIKSGPEMLTYPELVTLGEQDEIRPDLQQKLVAHNTVRE